MNFASLPPYRGPDDCPNGPGDEPFDRASLADTVGLVAICLVVLAVAIAACGLVFVSMVAAPAG